MRCTFIHPQDNSTTKTRPNRKGFDTLVRPVLVVPVSDAPENAEFQFSIYSRTTSAELRFSTAFRSGRVLNAKFLLMRVGSTVDNPQAWQHCRADVLRYKTALAEVAAPPWAD